MRVSPWLMLVACTLWWSPATAQSFSLNFGSDVRKPASAASPRGKKAAIPARKVVLASVLMPPQRAAELGLNASGWAEDQHPRHVDALTQALLPAVEGAPAEAGSVDHAVGSSSAIAESEASAPSAENTEPNRPLDPVDEFRAAVLKSNAARHDELYPALFVPVAPQNRRPVPTHPSAVIRGLEGYDYIAAKGVVALVGPDSGRIVQLFWDTCRFAEGSHLGWLDIGFSHIQKWRLDFYTGGAQLGVSHQPWTAAQSRS